jgi:hypothetical protein
VTAATGPPATGGNATTPAAAPAAAATAAPAPAPAPASLSEDELALAQGVKLFKQSHFKEALGIFNILELKNPDDARIWYFAALSHGFATGQWGGGTERLVEKGIERERAGTPSTVLIDASFNDLTAAQGHDWIAEYRRRAARRPDVSAVNPDGGTSMRNPPG